MMHAQGIALCWDSRGKIAYFSLSTPGAAAGIIAEGIRALLADKSIAKVAIATVERCNEIIGSMLLLPCPMSSHPVCVCVCVRARARLGTFAQVLL